MRTVRVSLIFTCWDYVFAYLPTNSYGNPNAPRFSPTTLARLRTAVGEWQTDASNATAQYGHITTWNTAQIKSMKKLFENRVGFNEPIGTWNTSNVKSMLKTFSHAEQFNQPIENWDTSRVSDMKAMFRQASVFNQPIGAWNIAAVGKMTETFLSATKFNQPIALWNTARVTDMYGLFDRASAFNQPIGGWNVAEVYHMRSMFRDAAAFNQPIGTWNTARVVHMDNLFRNASQFNQPLESWDTGRVASMYRMFKHIPFNQPIGSWNTARVANMKEMFMDNQAFNQYIGNWNTVSLEYLVGMFDHANSFNQPIGSWNTARVHSMSGTFSSAVGFNQPIRTWNTASVTYMRNMFDRASAFNQPIENWNTANVKVMGEIFSGAHVFNQPIGSWNTARVTSMEGIFVGALRFNHPLGNWNTASVISMDDMFSAAAKFNQPIASWNILRVASMAGIFVGAVSFCQNIDAWTGSSAYSSGGNTKPVQIWPACATTITTTTTTSTTSQATCKVGYFTLPNSNNMARMDPTNANHGDCTGRYAAGYFHSHVQWSKVVIDLSTLRLDAKNHHYASLVAGNTLLSFGTAGDCHWSHTTNGEAVIDLRGTPFKVDGDSSCACQVGSGHCTCSQWTVSGWRPRGELTCQDNNQFCQMRCGGNSGSCYLASNYLQLAWVNSQSQFATLECMECNLGYTLFGTTCQPTTTNTTSTTSTSTTTSTTTYVLVTTSSPGTTTTSTSTTSTTMTTTTKPLPHNIPLAMTLALITSSRGTTTTSKSTTSLVMATMTTTSSLPRATMSTSLSSALMATTHTATTMNRVVDGSLIVTVSNATRFVNEPNITIAMKMAIAELCAVNISWIHNVTVSLVPDRRLLPLNTRFHGSEDHYMNIRSLSGAGSADLTVWPNSRVKVEFRIVIPASGPTNIIATTIAQKFDSTSLAAADLVINQVLKSGILGSRYDATVVRKMVKSSVAPPLTPAPAPQSKALPKWWLIVAVIALVSTACPCILFCVLNLKTYTGKHPSETVSSEKSVAEWSMLELLCPPSVISKDMHRKLQSRANGLAQHVKTDDHEVFIAFSLGQREGDAEDSGPGFFYALAVALNLETHGVPCCLSYSKHGNGDCFADTSFEVHRGVMMLVVVETRALYHCAQCLLSIHSALKNNTAIIRMRFEDNIPPAHEWWPDMITNYATENTQTSELVWFAMREFVLERLRAISPCPPPPNTVAKVEGLMDDFAVDMKSRLLMISSKNTMALEDDGQGITEITSATSSSLLLPNNTPLSQPKQKRNIVCVEPVVCSGKGRPQAKKRRNPPPQRATEESERSNSQNASVRRTRTPQHSSPKESVGARSVFASARDTESQLVSSVGPDSNPMRPVRLGRSHGKSQAKDTSRKITNNGSTNIDATRTLSGSSIGRPGPGSTTLQPAGPVRSHTKARAKGTSRKITNNGAANIHAASTLQASSIGRCGARLALGELGSTTLQPAGPDRSHTKARAKDTSRKITNDGAANIHAASTLPACITGHGEVETPGSAQNHGHDIQRGTRAVGRPARSQKPPVRNRSKGQAL